MPAAQAPPARALSLLLFATACAASAASAACATRGAPVEVPVDVNVSPITADAGPNLRVDNTSGKCTAELHAARIEKSSPGCIIDEQISKTTGTLTYPCTSDGPVEAEFGNQRYTGVIVNGEVELTLDTELDWEDGCRWGTRALIKGHLLSSSEATSKRLTWTYRDTILSGSDCSGACTARSSFQVTTSRKSHAPLPSPKKEDEEQDTD